MLKSYSRTLVIALNTLAEAQLSHLCLKSLYTGTACLHINSTQTLNNNSPPYPIHSSLRWLSMLAAA